MSKRKLFKRRLPPSKRFREPPNSPFGFEIERYALAVRLPCGLRPTAHKLSNTIVGFGPNGNPRFHRWKDEFKIENVQGTLVSLSLVKHEDNDTKFVPIPKRVLTSELHTPHTVSVYKLAHDILNIIKARPKVSLVTEEAKNEFSVDIRGSKTATRRTSEDKVFLNARWHGERVVLKTSTRLSTVLRYAVEAVIHHIVAKASPSYFPALKFVAVSTDDQFVICSEQLRMPSVFTWVSNLGNVPFKNLNNKLWHMLRNVSRCLKNVQTHAHFTHRDCHTGNVYYDEFERESVKFIDMDWSSTVHKGRVIAVPRHLYDSTRPQNKSVDLCVFLRTLGPSLRRPKHLKEGANLHKWEHFERRTEKFYRHVYLPLMQRYERESEAFLKARIATDSAAVQLYKLCVDKKSKCVDKKSNFEHVNGIEKVGVDFDYRMGYFEYDSMTPTSVLSYLEEQKHLMYPPARWSQPSPDTPPQKARRNLQII